MVHVVKYLYSIYLSTFDFTVKKLLGGKTTASSSASPTSCRTTVGLIASMVFPSYSHPNMDVDNDATVDVEPSLEPMRVMDVNLPRLAARSVANVYDPNKLKRAHRRGTPPSPRERCRSCLHTKGTLTLPSFQTFSCRKQGDDSEAHRFLFLLSLLCNIPIWLILNASDADVAAAPELCFCSHLGVSPKEYTLDGAAAVPSRRARKRPVIPYSGYTEQPSPAKKLAKKAPLPATLGYGTEPTGVHLCTALPPWSCAFAHAGRRKPRLAF